MKYLCAIPLLFLSSVPCHAEKPAADSLLRPYYDCMILHVAKYSRKTTDVNEAIDAAKSACSKQRDEVLAQAEADFIAKGRSQYQAKETAKAVERKMDESFRQDFVRAALDAR